MDVRICKHECGLALGCPLIWSCRGENNNYAFWAFPRRKDFSDTLKNHCRVYFKFDDDVKAQFEFFNILQKLPNFPKITNVKLASKFLVPDKDCPFYTEHMIYDANRKKR